MSWDSSIVLPHYYVILVKKNNIKEIKKISQENLIHFKDNMGNTLLHEAAYYGHLEIVRYLWKKGSVIDARNKDGYTPLSAAVIGQQLAVASFLLAHGADPLTESANNTCVLVLACRLDNIELVKLLVEYGANTSDPLIVQEKYEYITSIQQQLYVMPKYKFSSR